MSLIKCKACSEKISSNAKSCPKCGEPTPKKTSTFTWMVLILVIFVFIIPAVVSTPTSTVEEKHDVVKSEPSASQIWNNKVEEERKEAQAILEQKDIDEAKSKNIPYDKYKTQKRIEYILSELKKIPAEEFTNNYNYYAELVRLEPNNISYMEKLKYYTTFTPPATLECGNEYSMYDFVFRASSKKNYHLQRSEHFTYKAFQTAYGYAFTLFYLKKNTHDVYSLIVHGNSSLTLI